MKKNLKENLADRHIIVDSREQDPLWKPFADVIKVSPLNSGDYAVSGFELKFAAERKSPQDLYQSLVQDHERFRQEIVRARVNGIDLKIFVECSKKLFISKKWKGGYFRKLKGNILAKIVHKFEEKYDTPFVWCVGREDMKTKILRWFNDQIKIYEHSGNS